MYSFWWSFVSLWVCFCVCVHAVEASFNISFKCRQNMTEWKRNEEEKDSWRNKSKEGVSVKKDKETVMSKEGQKHCARRQKSEKLQEFRESLPVSSVECSAMSFRSNFFWKKKFYYLYEGHFSWGETDPQPFEVNPLCRKTIYLCKNETGSRIDEHIWFPVQTRPLITPNLSLQRGGIHTQTQLETSWFPSMLCSHSWPPSVTLSLKSPPYRLDLHHPHT